MGITAATDGTDSVLGSASFSESESIISITDIALAGRDPRLETGELAREEGANDSMSDAAFETGELALEDGKNEARLLARDVREKAIDTEEEAREGARELTEADSLSILRGSAWVAI